MSFTAGRTKPCAGCPWRVGNASRSLGIAALHEAASSTFDGSTGWNTIMACHTNPPGTDGACVGYLLTDHAFDNLSVRMAAAREPETFGALEPDGDLHATYPEMLAALLDSGRYG